MGGLLLPPLVGLSPRVTVWYVDYTKPYYVPIDPKPGDYVIYIFETGRWVKVRW